MSSAQGHIAKRELVRKDRKTGETRTEVVYRARMPKPGGTGTQQIEATFRRRIDAQRWLNQQRAEVTRGEHIDRVTAATTFAAVVAEWKSGLVDVGPKTMRTYESTINKHLEPAFGKRPIGKITRADVQKFVTDLADKRAPGTTRNAFAVLRNILNHAVVAGYIRASPCVKIRVPRSKKRDVPVLTAAEVGIVAEAMVDRAAELEEPSYRLAVLLAAYGGPRAGETWALRRSAIDLDRGRVRIVETIKEIGKDKIEGPPKTHEERAFPLPAFLTAELRAHLASRPADPRARVFVDADGETVSHAHVYEQHFKPTIAALVERGDLPREKAGLRWHDLRHTCASLLIAQGVHPRAITQHLGHSSIRITMDRYGHLFPADDDRVTDALDAIHAQAKPAADLEPREIPAALADLPDIAAGLDALERGDHDGAITALIDAAVMLADGRDALRATVEGILADRPATDPLAVRARERLAGQG